MAGLNEIDVELHVSEAAFFGAVDSAVLYAESAAAVGINIQIMREPNDGYWSNVWMRKPWTAASWNGRLLEDQMFSMAYQASARFNDTVWQNDQFDQLLIAARSELDEQRRRSIYFDMQEILYNDGGLICPMFADYITARSIKLNTPPADNSAYGPLSGYRITTRGWYA